MSYTQGLCGAVIDNLRARRACMTEHGVELSADCKAAIAQWRGREGGVTHASQGVRCSLRVQTGCQDAVDTSRFLFQRTQPGNLNAGKAAVLRCMRGQPIGC